MLSGPSFREHRNFERFARDLVRLPGPGEDPLAHLLPEARWRELTHGVPDEAAWLMALSQATGVYFFPSREWVQTLMRYLKLLGVTRLLEAGAGRGYLTAALAPACAAAGIRFRAVDTRRRRVRLGPAGLCRGGAGRRPHRGPGVAAGGGALCLAAAGTIGGPPLPNGFSALSYFDRGSRRRRHRGPGGLGDPAPQGFPGPVAVRPGTHRRPEPPGDRLLRRQRIGSVPGRKLEARCSFPSSCLGTHLYAKLLLGDKRVTFGNAGF